jgi:hypothetical protein
MNLNEKLIDIQWNPRSDLYGPYVILRIQGPTVVRNVWMTIPDFISLTAGCLQFLTEDVNAMLERAEEQERS